MLLSPLQSDRNVLPGCPPLERRRHGRFRIFYIEFSSFVNRFILGKRESEGGAKAEPEKELPLSAYMEKPAAEVSPKLHSKPKPQSRTPLFNLGIEAIDRQHEQLLAALHRLQKSVASGPKGATASAEEVKLCAEDHFNFEETFMAQTRFPDLTRHQQDHEYFRQQLQRFKTHAAAGDTFVAMEISASLFHWLQDHILQEDRAYALHSRKAC